MKDEYDRFCETLGKFVMAGITFGGVAWIAVKVFQLLSHGLEMLRGCV